MKKFILILVFLVFLAIISAIFLLGHSYLNQSPKNEVVEIKDVKYQSGNILLTLQASTTAEDTRIDIINSEGKILCTQYKNLVPGNNQFEITECPVEKDMKVSVGVPEQSIIVKKFKLDLPEPVVKIKDAEYEVADLVLTLDSNLEVKNVRVEVVSEGNVLCTKYIDLPKGDSEQKFSDCGVEEKVTISVTAPGGTLSTRDFDLEIPAFRFQKGYKYDYSSTSYSNQQEISVYVTEDNSDYIEGLAGIKRSGNLASILRFKIRKNDLDLEATYPLAADAISSSSVDYNSVKEIARIGEAGNSLLPFWLILISETEGLSGLNLEELFSKKTIIASQSSSPEATITLKIEDTLIENDLLVDKISIIIKEGKEIKNAGELYVSPIKPYPLLKINLFEGSGSLIFKKLEKKDFSLDDYAGYTIEEWREPQLQIPIVVQPEQVQPEEAQPTTGAVIFNIFS